MNHTGDIWRNKRGNNRFRGAKRASGHVVERKTVFTAYRNCGLVVQTQIHKLVNRPLEPDYMWAECALDESFR